MVVAKHHQYLQIPWSSLYSMLWQHLLAAFAMDHSSQLLFALYGGRYASQFLWLFTILLSNFSVYLVPFFFKIYFRSGEFGQRLATMSVYFAVLISCFILWRLLFVFSTSMPMFRYYFSVCLLCHVSKLFECLKLFLVLGHAINSFQWKKKMVQGKLSVAYVCGAEHWQLINKLYIVDLSESGCLDCSVGPLGNRF